MEGFTGHGSGPFSPGDGMHHRNGSSSTLRTFEPEAGIRVPVNASSRGGVWRTIPAEVPSPEVSLPGPFVLAPSPVLPVLLSWLHTPADNCGVRAESSVRARTRTGRLWCVVYPPFISSPFLLVVYLVPSHCGSRALSGLCGSISFRFPGAMPLAGVMKTWPCLSFVFIPVPLRVFPPLAKGGSGGVVPAEPGPGTRFRGGWTPRNCR